MTRLPTVIVDPARATVTTLFPDGSSVTAVPDGTDAQRQTAAELGYGEDVARMTLTHDPLHTLWAALNDLPWSPTLWRVAHGWPLDVDVVRLEEARVLAWQRETAGRRWPWEVA